MTPSKWHLETSFWKEKLSFLFFIFDPWVFACWAILFVVGVLASNIYWNFFTHYDGESIIFDRFSVPWFFSTEIAQDQRHQIDDLVYSNIYTSIKACIYGGLLFAFMKLRPDKQKLQNTSYFLIAVGFFIETLFEHFPEILSGEPNCRGANALIFSPYFTFLGFSIPFIFSWLVAPLWEEITFRGLMFNWLQHRSAIFRILCTSVLFAYVHVVSRTGFMFPTITSIFGSFMVSIVFVWFPAGLLFGYAREKTGGILVPFALHSVSNMMVSLLGVILINSGLCPAP